MCDFIFVQFHLLAIHFHFGLGASMALADTPCSQMCGQGLALGLCGGKCSVSMSSGPVEPRGDSFTFMMGVIMSGHFLRHPNMLTKIFL